MRFLLVAMLAIVVPVRAEEPDLVRPALQRLLDLEQSIPRGGVEGQVRWETEFREKTTATMRPLSRLLRAHGLRIKPVPEEWLKLRAKGHEWPGASDWLKGFDVMSEEERCERVRLAYAFDLWQLTGLTADPPFTELKDLLIRDYTDMDGLWRDRARAAWAFRHIHAIPLASVPQACAAEAKEAAARWEFIFSDERRPTGLARFMCGRPMNAHWDDDAIDAKKKPEPRGWTHPVD